MPFIIDIDSLRAEAIVENMVNKLVSVPVAVELVQWQRHDMRRRFPYIEAVNPTTALTLIYPRSRRKSGWRKALSVAKAKPVRRGKAVRIVGGVPGNRPILRPELFDRLRERMRDMMAREITW